MWFTSPRTSGMQCCSPFVRLSSIRARSVRLSLGCTCRHHRGRAASRTSSLRKLQKSKLVLRRISATSLVQLCALDCHGRLYMVDSSPSGKPAFDKITGYIHKAKEAGGEILIGGSGTSPTVSRFHSSLPILSSADDSKGYFVQPTVILTKDPRSITMREEIFGPVVTVRCIISISRCAHLRTDEWGLSGLCV